jgi:hypothetical protein
MTTTDDDLMAYLDGELDAPRRAAFEARLAADAALAARLARLRALDARLHAAFDPVLGEPVPARLHEALTPPAAPVIDLAAARRTRRPVWALAASLLVGVVVGVLVGTRGPAGAGPLQLAADGTLRARGELDGLLSRVPAGGAGTARIVLSFLDREGVYCRAFVLERAQPLAGLACRADEGWRVQTLAAAAAAPAGELRPAASALPPALLRAIDERIAGEALDAAGEQAALARGWRR